MKKLIIFVLAIVLCGSCTSEKSISKKIKFQKEVNFEHSMKLNNSIKNYGLNENNIAINPKLNPENQESEEKQFIASTNEIVPLYSKNKDGNNLYPIDKSLDTKILNKQKIIIGNKKNKKTREPKKKLKSILKNLGLVVLFWAAIFGLVILLFVLFPPSFTI